MTKSQLPSAIKYTIYQLGTSPKAKQALTQKLKEILSNILVAKPITDNSGAIMSNIFLAWDKSDLVLRGLGNFHLSIIYHGYSQQCRCTVVASVLTTLDRAQLSLSTSGTAAQCQLDGQT